MIGIGFTRNTFGFTRKTIGFMRKTLDFMRKTYDFTRKILDFTRKTVIYDTNGLPYTGRGLLVDHQPSKCMVVHVWGRMKWSYRAHGMHQLLRHKLRKNGAQQCLRLSEWNYRSLPVSSRRKMMSVVRAYVGDILDGG